MQLKDLFLSLVVDLHRSVAHIAEQDVTRERMFQNDNPTHNPSLSYLIPIQSRDTDHKCAPVYTSFPRRN